ncbi:outer membrane beta-barrel protein [Aridibaculum aurantiacum]|uniref:outer membrane beta-barrel protein n=1 Tax=Aridibaculum aurantiacum TaxID=2810307 RepID=UPI001A970C81|nr:outer membrane beta-barrel protein [Aridibaculum aurantiacum]
MKKILACMTVAAALFTTASYAQVGQTTLGVGLDVGVPTGDFNNTQKIGIGGTADFGYNVGTGTALTLTVGYISFSGDEVGTFKYPAVNTIPIKAGVRYFVGPGLYLEPQLGYTSISTPNSNTSGTGGFTYAAKAGYRISNSLDLSARYEGISRNNANLNFLGFRLGYNFRL